MKTYINANGCGCCADYWVVEKVGDVLMPDGKVIHQYARVDDGKVYWVDPDIGSTWTGRSY